MTNVAKHIAREDRMEEVAFALARNEVGARLPLQELLSQEGIDERELQRYLGDAVFQKRVKQLSTELRANGVSFQLKARLQAEELLKKQWMIVHDPDTPPAVAVRAIENTVRWAGLDVAQQGGALEGKAGFSITINMGAVQQEYKAAQAIEVKEALAAPVREDDE